MTEYVRIRFDTNSSPLPCATTDAPELVTAKRPRFLSPRHFESDRVDPDFAHDVPERPMILAVVGVGAL